MTNQNHSEWLVSDLCTSLREIDERLQDCWSPARRERLLAERAELRAEMTRRGFDVEGDVETVRVAVRDALPLLKGFSYAVLELPGERFQARSLTLAKPYSGSFASGVFE